MAAQVPPLAFGTYPVTTDKLAHAPLVSAQVNTDTRDARATPFPIMGIGASAGGAGSV